MDITGFEDHKRRSMLAYESQFVIPEKNRRIIDVMMSSVTYFGSRIGTAAAEPFYTKEPLGLGGFQGLVGM